MKTLITCIAALFVIVACSNDDDANNNDVLGTWVLTEVLIDPGDGSGTFQPTQMYRTITFHNDGTYTANESFCSFYIDFGISTMTGNYTDTKIICTSDYELPYTIEDGALIVSYPCDEVCKAKFQQQVP